MCSCRVCVGVDLRLAVVCVGEPCKKSNQWGNARKLGHCYERSRAMRSFARSPQAQQHPDGASELRLLVGAELASAVDTHQRQHDERAHAVRQKTGARCSKGPIAFVAKRNGQDFRTEVIGNDQLHELKHDCPEEKIAMCRGYVVMSYPVRQDAEKCKDGSGLCPTMRAAQRAIADALARILQKNPGIDKVLVVGIDVCPGILKPKDGQDFVFMSRFFWLEPVTVFPGQLILLEHWSPAPEAKLIFVVCHLRRYYDAVSSLFAEQVCAGKIPGAQLLFATLEGAYQVLSAAEAVGKTVHAIGETGSRQSLNSLTAQP